MALISPRPFPDDARLAVSRIKLTPVQSINQTLNGAFQVMEQGDPQWLGTFRTQRLLWSRRRLWSAWGTSLGEGRDTFMAYDWAASYPIAYGKGVQSLLRAVGGGFDGTATLNGYTATTIQIAGLPANYRATAGDRISFPWNGSRSYHEVAENAVATPFGVINVAVHPPVPNGPDPTPGVTADLVRAPVVMRLKPGTFDAPDGAGSLPISFEGVQDRTPVYQPETLALRSRMTDLPDSRLFLMDGLIYRLKVAGVWDKLDALWLLAAHNAAGGQVNWIGPQYNLVAVNSPTFSVNAGFIGNGASSYFRTGFINTYGTKATGASASLGAFVNAAGASEQNSLMGSTQVADNVGRGNRLLRRYNVSPGVYTNMVAANSANTANGHPGELPGYGSYIASRVSEAGANYYYNAAFVSLFDGPSGVSGLENYLCAENLGGGPALFSADRIAAAFIGGGLTAGEVSALHGAIRSYLDGIGAP